ncbi:MAG: sodium/proline symporter [Polyangiales bacterium]
MILVAFVLSLLSFVLIGAWSATKKQDNIEDYLVVGRRVPAWLSALSSAATNNSGFMFIGLIGFAYRFGVQAIWLQAGWIFGDYLAWRWVHARVRTVSGEIRACSTPALLATDDTGGVARSISIGAGVLTFLFLGGYAAAQFNAGSTALHTLFGWDLRVGAWLGAIIVLLYSFSGGLRASIWTDAAQAFVMIVSMIAVVYAAYSRVGGPEALFTALEELDPDLLVWAPDTLRFGLAVYVLGFVCGGFGVVGQPHILARSMAIESAEAVGTARKIYFAWFIPFSILAVLAGLYARVLLPELAQGVTESALISAQSAERALPAMVMQTLPDFWVGFVLAGLFSATMSTADSQVLACSAAITQDIAPRWRESYLASKIATTAVTMLALVFALNASEGVFDLVLGAWSALGASLGPLVILRVFKRRVPPSLAMAMMCAGIATTSFWDASPWSGAVFKLLPAMIVPFMIYAGYAFIVRGSRSS